MFNWSEGGYYLGLLKYQVLLIWQFAPLFPRFYRSWLYAAFAPPFLVSVTLFDADKLNIMPLWQLSAQSMSQDLGIDYCTKKETTLTVGHFTTISDHFSANYINIFHKTGVQRNILRCLTCLSLNWVKSYNIKHNFIHFEGFSNL